MTALIFAALLCAALPSRASALDPGRDLILYWPAADDSAVRLLREIGARVLITTLPGESAPVSAVPAACEHAGILLIAEVPPEPSLEALGAAVSKARTLGFQGAAVSAIGDAASFQEFVRNQGGFVPFAYLKPEQVSWDVSPAYAVLRSGVWPGVPARDPTAAGASESLWVDANSSLVAYLRGVFPDRPAILGYRPDEAAGVSANRIVPYESAEIALADAFAAGGSLILSVPDSYRKALLRRDPRARAAWASLARLAAFFGKHSEEVRHEAWARTAVVAGDLEQSGEVLNLAYRKNLCPVVLRADRVPTLEPSRLDVVAAVNVSVPSEGARNLIRFVEAGGTVLAAPPADGKMAWWSSQGKEKLMTEDGRDVYALGNGKVYAYHSAIDDPGEFALDLKDAAGEKSQPATGPKNLDVRIWAADTVLGVFHRTGPGKLALVLTNYGSPIEWDFLVGVRGRFVKATIADATGEGTKPLVMMPRAGRVELNMRGLHRVAMVFLEEEGN